MCWSETATFAMVGLGTAATVATWRRGDPAGIWGTLGYFTLMEGLQAWGYGVVDQCGTPANTTVSAPGVNFVAQRRTQLCWRLARIGCRTARHTRPHRPRLTGWHWTVCDARSAGRGCLALCTPPGCLCRLPESPARTGLSSHGLHMSPSGCARSSVECSTETGPQATSS